MKGIRRQDIESLRKPTSSSKEPIAEIVGTYYMARMISKKTKFRVLDVKEVLDEVGPCIYALLLQRKTINFNGINIRSKWFRHGYPKYIRTNGHLNDEGYWTYGYFKPTIDFEKKEYLMYGGFSGEHMDDYMNPLLERVTPYLPEGINTEQDLIEYVDGIIKETCQLGKDYIIDEEGYVIPIPPKRKRHKFNPDFHPNIIERIRYKMLRKRYLIEYHNSKNTDNPLPFEYVFESLAKHGFYQNFTKDSGRITENMVINTNEESEDM